MLVYATVYMNIFNMLHYIILKQAYYTLKYDETRNMKK